MFAPGGHEVTGLGALFAFFHRADGQTNKGLRDWVLTLQRMHNNNTKA